MTLEEFQAWREHPATQWVLRAAEKAADLQQIAWNDASWGRGEADPLMLTELRTRADAYRALGETSYEDWCSVLGEEPKES
jgi:hypothetical protein